MKTKTVPSGWLQHDGRRLDCGPYMSGALEARVLLNRLAASKENLVDLCKGGSSGIYHAGRETRRWVTDPQCGVPFLGSTDILCADFVGLPLLDKSQLRSNPRLRIESAWTLITRTGTIGRMAYSRPDMAGMACSEHVIRVVPNAERIAPGYLYAFLSSKFGVPLITGGTYGSIIQSIEPHHIETLPVPRLGERLEQESHRLVEEASAKRVEAAGVLAQAVRELEASGGLKPLARPDSPAPYGISSVSSSRVQSRLDAFFHSDFHQDPLKLLAKCARTTIRQVSTRIAEPPRFKRLSVEDAEFGVAFFGTTALFWADPVRSYFLARGMRGIHEYIVDRRCVLIPRSGQLSGIIGAAVLPYGDIIGGAVSEDAIRVHCANEDDAGFVFVALTSEYGRRQLKARAFGSSIPHLDVKHIGAVVVPDLGETGRRAIGRQGARVSHLREAAIHLEREARSLVEQQIGRAN